MLSEVSVETGVPIPKSRGGGSLRGRAPKWPYADLSVGESFFAEGRAAKSMSGSIAWAQKSLGIRLSLRCVEENGAKGVRVWRVE